MFRKAGERWEPDHRSPETRARNALQFSRRQPLRGLVPRPQPPARGPRVRPGHVLRPGNRARDVLGRARPCRHRHTGRRPPAGWTSSSKAPSGRTPPTPAPRRPSMGRPSSPSMTRRATRCCGSGRPRRQPPRARDDGAMGSRCARREPPSRDCGRSEPRRHRPPRHDARPLPYRRADRAGPLRLDGRPARTPRSTHSAATWSAWKCRGSARSSRARRSRLPTTSTRARKLLYRLEVERVDESFRPAGYAGGRRCDRRPTARHVRAPQLRALQSGRRPTSRPCAPTWTPVASPGAWRSSWAAAAAWEPTWPPRSPWLARACT